MVTAGTFNKDRNLVSYRLLGSIYLSIGHVCWVMSFSSFLSLRARACLRHGVPWFVLCENTLICGAKFPLTCQLGFVVYRVVVVVGEKRCRWLKYCVPAPVVCIVNLPVFHDPQTLA